MADTVKGSNITRTMPLASDEQPSDFYLFQCLPTGRDGLPVPVRLEGSLSIGRSEEDGNDFVVPDTLMSRVHATIRRCSPGPYVIVDADSKNGSFVNGVRVRHRVVGDGDCIRLGGTLFVLREVGLDLPPATALDARFVGFSPDFRKTVASCEQVAPSNTTVLLAGETGTGKEVLAHHLHERSGRHGKLVPVNCAAVASGLFESALFGHRKGAFTGATSDFNGFARAARGGTLFLDEVGELPPEVQGKLLRFLESGEVATVGEAEPTSVDVRVVAATNRDLEEAVAAGSFRKDLYARLATWIVRIPPLRERPEDVLILAQSVLAKTGHTIGPDSAEALMLHEWPYNIRELLALCGEVALKTPGGSEIPLSQLPDIVRAKVQPRQDECSGAPAGHDEAAPSREAIKTLWQETAGNVSEMARRLGKDRRQVYRWLTRFGLK